MRSVRKEWLELTQGNKSEGKLVRFYNAQGTPKFEGKITPYGWGNRQLGEQGFKWARFNECRTLNKDLTTRKGSASIREQTIPYDWQFIFVGEDQEISIPKTAGELTDEHIGMTFKFYGSPTIIGVYQGLKTVREKGQSLHLGVYSEFNSAWNINDRGYFIRRGDKLDYLADTRNPSGGGVDTDAKLATYLNQELSKWMEKIGSYEPFPETYGLGQEVVRIIKEITQPTP